MGDGKGLYLFLNIIFAGDHLEDTVEEQLAELVHVVLFPVFNALFEFGEGFRTQFAVDGGVGLEEDSVGGVNSGLEFGLGGFVCARFVA